MPLSHTHPLSETRAQAQQFHRLITAHKDSTQQSTREHLMPRGNNSGREIAIWYNEYIGLTRIAA